MVIDAALSLPPPRGAGARGDGWETAFALGVYAYPAIFVSSLYLTWFVAWGSLGHAPRPSLDDPKYIGTLVDIPYVVTMALLIGAPGALALGLILTPLVFIRRVAPLGRSVLLGLVATVVLILLWGAALWLLRADPWGVGAWYCD